MNNDLSATEAIRRRRSIRKYKAGAEVTDEQLHMLLEAAMMAPSACNTRPWEFIVIRSRQKLDELAKVHPYAGMLKTASLAIIICALPGAQEGISDGFFPQDCGAATQNILIQAAALGLGTCWCGVFPKEQRILEVRNILEFPDNSRAIPFNIIAVGLPDVVPGARGFYEPAKVRYL
jgi:nitroreductase